MLKQLTSRLIRFGDCPSNDVEYNAVVVTGSLIFFCICLREHF
jgi:hypothetical protein